MLQVHGFLVATLVGTWILGSATEAKASQAMTPQLTFDVKKLPLQLSEELSDQEQDTAEGLVAETESTSCTQGPRLLQDLWILLVGFTTCKLYKVLRSSAHSRAVTKPRPDT